MPQTTAPTEKASKHTLPPLPYDDAALEPYIDAQTMQIHHGKHHQAYVSNLNAALDKHPALYEKSLEALLRGRSEERRVGKECRCGWSSKRAKRKTRNR